VPPENYSQMHDISLVDHHLRNDREVFDSNVIANLQSVHADLLECKAACTLDIAAESDLEILLVELMNDFSDISNDTRKEVERCKLSANYFLQLYKDADSATLSLREENDRLRSQVDEAVMKYENLLQNQQLAHSKGSCNHEDDLAEVCIDLRF
jgi:hypothetical protein